MQRVSLSLFLFALDQEDWLPWPDQLSATYLPTYRKDQINPSYANSYVEWTVAEIESRTTQLHI